ncbi:hypothetical protein D8674_042011 [Pyrus ussuriensis x Pyrus communis]|uniref:Pentatricopeptide repeat-containing protein n=1 Tax=Pyrus ussuriensis x Pyrus communis TaxID=2448454 RepID=A0A5N5GEJ4_9ROSA|nr:hypothetical protein D8674_042011 [Pyrus ussuriensis x Pyrus communis]
MLEIPTLNCDSNKNSEQWQDFGGRCVVSGDDMFWVEAKNQEIREMGMALDKQIFNSIIDTFGKYGELDEALEVFDKMKQEGVKPDIMTFNSLIRWHSFLSSLSFLFLFTLQVADVYVLELLGTILNDVELATSEDRRQVLLRRLHSLHSVKATNSSQGSLDGETAKKQTVFNLSKKLEPCVWWFRTVTLKFGSARVVISNGKIVSGFLILLVYYVLRRKQATLKRIMQRQALTRKKALVDLWQLAFSYQVNPLAAVQPLAAATQGGW